MLILAFITPDLIPFCNKVAIWLQRKVIQLADGQPNPPYRHHAFCATQESWLHSNEIDCRSFTAIFQTKKTIDAMVTSNLSLEPNLFY